jgi:hypothetical protein
MSMKNFNHGWEERDHKTTDHRTTKGDGRDQKANIELPTSKTERLNNS